MRPVRKIFEALEAHTEGNIMDVNIMFKQDCMSRLNTGLCIIGKYIYHGYKYLIHGYIYHE